MISVDAAIPCGRVAVRSTRDASDIQLEIPKDPHSNFVGWYHFRAIGVRGRPCRFRLVNAGESRAARLPNREGMEDRWTGTGPLASYDLVNWFRIPGAFDGTVFSFEHRPAFDVCYYAAFAPFTPERDQQLIARALASPLARLQTLGRSLQGRSIDLLTIGTPAPARKNCWVIARQHPSETQGGFFIEGFLGRLLDANDVAAQALLDAATFHIVPNMNPDGCANGLSRTTSTGVNLNREWRSPSAGASPEVVAVQAGMRRIGLDFCIDCHADAELRCNFVWPSQNVPTWSAERQQLFAHFENAWHAASPDYGFGEPYPGGVPDEADLSMAWNWIGNEFPHALSVLLEQPFKDTRHTPVPATGWTPQRAARLGASLVDGLLGVVDHLRPATKGATTAPQPITVSQLAAPSAARKVS
jgi:murein tripeptide amidase MpaA